MNKLDSLIFFVTHANANATLRSTRTTNPAKAFSIAMNSPKPVNITVWSDNQDAFAKEEVHTFYPSNFICTSKDEVFKAFSIITGGKLP